jgi:hypothetical protein|tara:strand:- start:3517 stop:3786 length:270 start_codon:yes stop_codon:yes gene_type:complete
MVVGRNMSVARNASGYTGLIKNRPVLSPLGGGLQPASWVTRRQYSRADVKSNLRFRTHLPAYTSKSESFGGVGAMYVGGHAYKRGGYVK